MVPCTVTMADINVEEVLKKLTITEKVELLSGKLPWRPQLPSGWEMPPRTASKRSHS